MMEKHEQIDLAKYGTAVLTEEDGSIATDLMADHGKVWRNHNSPLSIVSSGAKGFGEDSGDFSYIGDPVMRSRAAAGHGNIELFSGWQTAISPQKKRIIIQALTTHRSFEDERSSRSQLIEFLVSIYKRPIYPIFTLNENDVLSDEELKMARGGEIGDNDENAARLAVLYTEIFDFVRLSIQTSTDGVWESAKNRSVISTLSAKEDLTDDFIKATCGDEKTNVGTGGMKGKLTHTRNALLSPQNKSLIEAWITNGKTVEQLEKVLSSQHAGTRIIKSHNLGEI